jgi:hypothetical protein
MQSNGTLYYEGAKTQVCWQGNGALAARRDNALTLRREREAERWKDGKMERGVWPGGVGQGFPNFFVSGHPINIFF